MKSLRGALVVVEGCDRSGKTTQCKKIVSTLQSENVQAEYMNFPGKPIAFICSLKNRFPSDDSVSVKFLGVYIGHKTWEEHISYISVKLSRGILFIKKY